MKRVIKLTLAVSFLLMALCSAPSLQGAPKGDDAANRSKWAEAQASKIASELQLPADKAEKFTELYLACQKEMWQLDRSCSPQNCNSRNIKTDKEAETVLKARFEKRRKINSIQEKYYKKYSAILTQRQILKMYEIERNMMEKMRGKKHPSVGQKHK